MKTRTPNAVLPLILGTAMLLGACGGGDDNPPPAPQQMPESAASASVGGFVAYLKALVVAAADRLEPVDTRAMTPPTDDTIEPTPVD